MKKATLPIFCSIVVFFSAFPLWAADFGLLLNQNAEYGGYVNDENFEYSGIAIPRFSALIGDNAELYISAGFKAEYKDSWELAPEILRTDFRWQFDSGELRLGRMYYSDPLAFITNGLFDGLSFSLYTDAGIFSVGAWYTGLLYNKRAYITMTDDELESYNAVIDYSDFSSFSDSYFASRRVISALEWEHPGLAQIVRANISFIGQFDLSDGDYLHTQYVVAKFAAPYNTFVFSLGGALELIEASGNDMQFAFAGELGAAWTLPTSFDSQLSFLGRFTSGVVIDNSIAAFLPVTTVTHGQILDCKISGLSMLSLNYVARFNKTFSAEISSSYFIRSDLGTYQDYDADGYFLGNEFCAYLSWSPASDIQVNLGCGAFLPMLGNSAPDGDILWRIGLNVIVALF